MKELSLYVHIPFCVRKCLYCDFLSFSVGTQRSRIDSYAELLRQEIRSRGRLCRDYEVKTVFFGGGTPSLAGAEWMQEWMDVIRHSFTLSEQAEITMEMNPGTVTAQSLAAYRRAGINRISIGLQSASDKELARIGRIHTYREFLEAFHQARENGFDNINVDLMSALPGQDLRSYQDTLSKVAELAPEHISAYSLILEEGTWLSEHQQEYSFPDEEQEREMYLLTGRYLETQGYHRYEISNYAKEGWECRHNKVYWQRGNYLGLGLGAASMMENVRFQNPSEPEAYEKAVLWGGGFSGEALSVAEQMEEFMFLGLRLTQGVEKSVFLEQFGVRLETVYGEVMSKLCRQGLLEETAERVFLTARGVDVSNRVMAEFLFD